MEFINGNEDRRHFIVAKEGRDVVVREVAKGSCSFTHTRDQAWACAQQLREHGNDKKKIRPGRVFFVELDSLMRTEVEWPEAKEENEEDSLDNEGESVHNEPMTNTTEIPLHVLARMGAEQISGMEMNRDTGEFDRPLDLPAVKPAATPAQPTDKQIALFNKLCTQIQGKPYTAGFGATVDRKAASAAIDAALKLTHESKRAQTQPIQPIESPEVPAGRYAIENDEGKLGFFQIDRPTEGRWSGYTFVKYQASDETYPVKNREQRERILSKIAQDVKSAMLRYGREIGKCGHCGRTLTDEDSRAAGIGPVCAGKVAWA